MGADGLVATVAHDPDAASAFLTEGNVTHRPRLFPGLDSNPKRAGFTATATMIPWDESWALPQFAIFPMVTPSLVTHGGNPSVWLFEDSYPVATAARPTHLIDNVFVCANLACVVEECFVGHCIASPDNMCSEPGVSDFVRLDLREHFLITSIFVAAVDVTETETSYWYQFSGAKVFVTDDPDFRDFGSADFCLQFTSEDQTGLDEEGQRRYLDVAHLECEGQYVYISRVVADSITTQGLGGGQVYGDLAFCELDLLGYTTPKPGTRFFLAPTLPAGTYSVDVYLQQEGLVHHLLGTEERRTFWEAELYCIDRYRGHLASPNTDVEYRQLQAYTRDMPSAYMTGMYSNALGCSELGRNCEGMAICETAAAGSGTCAVPYDDLTSARFKPADLENVWQFTDGTHADVEFLRTRTSEPLLGRTVTVGNLVGDWNDDGAEDRLEIVGREYNKLYLSHRGPTGIKLLNTTMYAHHHEEGDAQHTPVSDEEDFLSHPLEALPTATYGGITGDWNGDQVPDIFLVNYGQPNQIFFGKGWVNQGAFVQCTPPGLATSAPEVCEEQLGEPISQGAKPSVGAISADYDGDGKCFSRSVPFRHVVLSISRMWCAQASRTSSCSTPASPTSCI